MSISERISELIKHLDISKNEFAHRIGTSSSMISQVTRGKESFRVDLLQKIICTFPSINSLWLLTGEGQMFTENTDQKVQNIYGKKVQKAFGDEKSSNYLTTDNQLNTNINKQLNSYKVRRGSIELQDSLPDWNKLYSLLIGCIDESNKLSSLISNILYDIDLIFNNLEFTKDYDPNLIFKDVIQLLSRYKDQEDDISHLFHELYTLRDQLNEIYKKQHS